jgi:hypothetical protein
MRNPLIAEIVSGVLDAAERVSVPAIVSFDNVRLANAALRSSLPADKSVSLGSVQQQLLEELKRTLSKELKSSALVALYEAVQIRPGFFGISIDLKRLLEHCIPDIRERLAGAALSPATLTRLKVLTTPGGTRTIVDEETVVGLLGRKSFYACLSAGILRVSHKRGRAYVELSHDMWVPAIMEA